MMSATVITYNTQAQAVSCFEFSQMGRLETPLRGLVDTSPGDHENTTRVQTVQEGHLHTK